MSQPSRSVLPAARRTGLEIREVGDDLVVYDLAADQLHLVTGEAAEQLRALDSSDRRRFLQTAFVVGGGAVLALVAPVAAAAASLPVIPPPNTGSLPQPPTIPGCDPTKVPHIEAGYIGGACDLGRRRVPILIRNFDKGTVQITATGEFGARGSLTITVPIDCAEIEEDLYLTISSINNQPVLFRAVQGAKVAEQQKNIDGCYGNPLI